MSHVTLDATVVLRVAGKKVFPLGLSNPPPLGKLAPSGKQGLAEVAEAGITLMRTGIETWSLNDLDVQVAGQKALLDGAAAAGLLCWLWLGNAASHPVSPTSEPVKLMTDIVNNFKNHPGLGLWKGAYEPANPLRGQFVLPPPPLVRAYKKLKTLDDIYRFAVEQVAISRGQFMELTIILILVLELVLFFLGIMK